MSSEETLVQREPVWSDILTFFRNRQYLTSLEKSLEYWNSLDENKGLDAKHKATILYTIVSSAYGLISTESKEHWQSFFIFLEKYCRLCQETAHCHGLGGVE